MGKQFVQCDFYKKVKEQKKIFSVQSKQNTNSDQFTTIECAQSFLFCDILSIPPRLSVESMTMFNIELSSVCHSFWFDVHDLVLQFVDIF